MRTIGFVVCAGILATALTVKASPIVDLGHYYVAENSSTSITLGASDSGNAAAEDIEGMTFTLQIANGMANTPSIASVNFLTNSIWSGHVSNSDISTASGGNAQFQSFTLITDNAGDFVNANGTLATIAFSAGSSTPGDYALKLTGTKDPGSDSQFTNGVGNLVPTTFGNGTLTVVAPGDFNRDGHVTAADIPVMLSALTDLNAYETAKSLTDSGLIAIGDLNGDNKITNADLQSLLDLLKSGGGSNTTVPEPDSFTLVSLGVLALVYCHFRKRGPGDYRV